MDPRWLKPLKQWQQHRILLRQMYPAYSEKRVIVKKPKWSYPANRFYIYWAVFLLRLVRIKKSHIVLNYYLYAVCLKHTYTVTYIHL